MVKRLIVFVLLLLSSNAWAGIKSGVYEALVLGVDETTGAITGYFEEHTGMPDKSGVSPFSCIFFISGKVEGSPPYGIRTWFPADRNPADVIEGTLEEDVKDSVPVLKIKLGKEHGGCWNVEHFADEKPASFDLDEAGDWRGVRVVASAKAYFHDQPDAAKKRKAYAVKGNPVRVYESVPNWVRAAYVNEDGKKTQGWIKESDLFSPVPPH